MFGVEMTTVERGEIKDQEGSIQVDNRGIIRPTAMSLIYDR